MENKKTNIPIGQGTTSRMNHRTLALPPGLAYDVAKKLKLYEEMAKIWGAHDKYMKNVVFKTKNNETKD